MTTCGSVLIAPPSNDERSAACGFALACPGRTSEREAASGEPSPHPTAGSRCLLLAGTTSRRYGRGGLVEGVGRRQDLGGHPRGVLRRQLEEPLLAADARRLRRSNAIVLRAGRRGNTTVAAIGQQLA